MLSSGRARQWHSVVVRKCYGWREGRRRATVDQRSSSWCSVRFDLDVVLTRRAPLRARDPFLKFIAIVACFRLPKDFGWNKTAAVRAALVELSRETMQLMAEALELPVRCTLGKAAPMRGYASQASGVFDRLDNGSSNDT